MKIAQNMGLAFRGFYVVMGICLIAAPFAFAASLQGWPRVVLPVFGTMALLSGTVGW